MSLPHMGALTVIRIYIYIHISARKTRIPGVAYNGRLTPGSRRRRRARRAERSSNTCRCEHFAAGPPRTSTRAVSGGGADDCPETGKIVCSPYREHALAAAEHTSARWVLGYAATATTVLYRCGTTGRLVAGVPPETNARLPTTVR